MKKPFFAALPALLLMPKLATAQNAFDGTWKMDTSKFDFPKKPDVLLLQDGIYACKSCTPPYNVKAAAQISPSVDIRTTTPSQLKS
jgi:hypothetical protein